MLRSVRRVAMTLSAMAGFLVSPVFSQQDGKEPAVPTLPAPDPVLPDLSAPRAAARPTKGEVNRIKAEFAKKAAELQEKYEALQQQEAELVEKTNVALLKVIEAAPDSLAALRAAQAVVELGIGDEETEKSIFKALAEHHLTSDELPYLCEAIASHNSEACVDFMQVVSAKAKDPRAKAWGLLCLADQECHKSESGVKADLKKAEEYLEQAIALVPETELEASPRDKAVHRLFTLQNLAIGKPCPEIELKDLDGKEVKLSDYKGKVVLLDFWATWCGYCVELIPSQRELVKKYGDKSFALIGISADDTPEEVVEFQKETPMPWVHWFNGPEGGVIDGWMIPSFPTLFVIDAKGVIRGRDIVDEKELDTLIGKLVEEAEAK